MKNYDEKDLKNVYPEVPEEFHAAVENALNELDQGKLVVIDRRRKAAKIIAACAAAAAVAAFTITAGATGFFGLFSEQKGTYGLHVGIDQSQSSTEGSSNEEKHVKIVCSYVPEGFVLASGNPELCMYVYGDDVYENRDKTYTISATGDKDFDQTYTNVIESHEDIVNGRKVVYMTFKYGENNEKLRYGAAVHFTDEGYVVYADNTDMTELEKIVAGLSLEEDTEFESRWAMLSESSDRFDTFGTPFDEVLVKADRTFTVSVNEKVEKDGRIERDNSANLTISLKDVQELTTDKGLDRDNFSHEIGFGGREYSLHDEYFNKDGTLKAAHVREIYNDRGENVYSTLGEVERTDAMRHFYLVTVAVSSDGDIQDLGNVMSSFGAVKSVSEESDEYFYASDGIFWGHYMLTGEALSIYSEGFKDEEPISKGQTRYFRVGLIVDEDVRDDAYLEIGISPDTRISCDEGAEYKNYTTYCVKLFE